MAVSALEPTFLDEVAEFLAGQPTREELLAYRPSPEAQSRVEILLRIAQAGTLSAEEATELQQFQQTENLMRLIKARLRNSGHV